jgi:hypothetical protein
MRALVRQGLDDLARAWPATLTAWLASLAAALAVEAALRQAGGDVRGALGDNGIGDLLHAMLVVLLGAAVGSLLLDSARSLALTAYARPGQPWLAAGFSRVPALITVTAVEITVEGFLLLGLALLGPTLLAAHAPLMGALAAAPALFLMLIMFGAGRVGVVLAARGLRPAFALLHGFDVVLRRLPSMVRLFAAVALYTLPLVLPAIVLRLAAALTHEWTLTASLARVLSLALFELAALVGYAALGNLVGGDPRLTTG